MRLLTRMMLVSAASLPCMAQATDFSLGAFGTLGIAHSNNRDIEYAPGSFRPEGVGASHAWNYDPDTLLGGQVTVNFFDKRLSIVAQAVSEQNYIDKYTPHIEWANIKYSFTPDLSVRVGRTALGSFLTSDSRKVAYTLPWVRVPTQVYETLPITNMDGVDTSYKIQFGKVGNTLQLMYGENVAKIGQSDGVDMKAIAKKLFGVFDTVEWGDLTVHYAYHQTDLYIMGATVPDKMKFSTIGLKYDPGSWFAMAEMSHKKQVGTMGTSISQAYYGSGGYRIATLTPYVLYSSTKDRTSHTLSGGLRWDALTNVSVKAQYDRYVTSSSGGAGGPPGTSSSSASSESADIINFDINFVF